MNAKCWHCCVTPQMLKHKQFGELTRTLCYARITSVFSRGNWKNVTIYFERDSFS